MLSIHGAHQEAAEALTSLSWEPETEADFVHLFIARKAMLNSEDDLELHGKLIMSVLTDFSEMVKTSIDEGIDIIFSGAGLPLDLPKYLTEGAKTKLVPIVSSGRAAGCRSAPG